MVEQWSLRMADSTMARFPLLAQDWNYQWGLVLKGFEHIWQRTRKQKYFDYIAHNIDAFVQPDSTIRSYRLNEYNVDRLNTGKVIFNLYTQTRKEKYKRALDLLRSQLDTHPRTPSGGFWHKQIYPNQMWLDGIYMADVFYAQYESIWGTNPARQTPNKKMNTWDDIAYQFILIEKHTRDTKTDLLYHAWDESKQQGWADPITGHSPNFWGRATGWYVMALVDVLEFLPRDHAQRNDLITILNRTIDALVRVQDAQSNVWHQLLDQGDRLGNYLESSASCMFVYAIAKGVRYNYLPQGLIDVAQRAYAGIIKQFVDIDLNSQVHLRGTCKSAGLGGNPYRDGSYDYYISEPIMTDNHHGVGAFLLASDEMEQTQ